MHDPECLRWDVCHSHPVGAAGSYISVWYPGSSSSENRRTFMPSTPRQNRVLELPVSGTGILCQELSAGLNVASDLWFFHSIQNSLFSRIACEVTITHPLLISSQSLWWGSYTLTERELPMMKLERPPMMYNKHVPGLLDLMLFWTDDVSVIHVSRCGDNTWHALRPACVNSHLDDNDRRFV